MPRGNFRSGVVIETDEPGEGRTQGLKPEDQDSMISLVMRLLANFRASIS
jgi:hypothetical protein